MPDSLTRNLFRLCATALLAVALLAGVTATASAQCNIIFECPPEEPEKPDPNPPVQPPPTPPVQPPRPAPVDPRGVSPSSPNPLKGLSFYVDPDEPANVQMRRFRRQGRHASAARISRIASQPRFRWFGRWTRKGPALVAKVRGYLDTAQQRQPGSVPLMTVMRHQGKKCSKNYAAGGRKEDARARTWYRRFARAIGGRRVVIAFEPDSLGTLECLKKGRAKARLKLLRYGVDVLSKLPNATIYLEGGASDWEPARRTARQLRYIGIRKVRGFMLNVTHYDWTGYNIKHGMDISRRVGGKPFIISTSFNGRGPVHFRKWVSRSRNIWRRINVWCHPLKRGLGPAPTTNTARKRVDAYMWIGRPGFSGGSCNGGPMPIGSWWAKRALMFSAHATNWIRPPRGTVNGHFKRYSLRALGGG